MAELEGADPFFLDANRVLAVFEGDGCGRQNATILDLRTRTQRPLKLSGDGARLSPVAVEGTQVVVQREGRGDSGCGGCRLWAPST